MPLDDISNAENYGGNPSVKAARPAAANSNLASTDLGKAIGQQLPGAAQQAMAGAAEQKKAADQEVKDLEGTRAKFATMTAPVPPMPQRAPEMPHTDPAGAWGSLAMGAAMLGSAFTRQPMVHALNAAAGVMNAYRKRDVDAYKLEFDRWKAETEYGSKLYEWQRDVYRDAIDMIKNEKTTVEGIAKARGIAAALNDLPLKTLLDTNKVQESLTLIDQRETAHEKATIEGQRTKAQWEAQQKGLDAVRERREAKTPEEAAAADQKLKDALEEAKIASSHSATGASDQRFQDEKALEADLEKEWRARPENAGKEPSATDKAGFRAQAHGAEVGRLPTQAAAREQEIERETKAKDEAWLASAENAGATSIPHDVHFQHRLDAEAGMKGATSQARSGPAMATQAFLAEQRKAGRTIENGGLKSDDVTSFNADYARKIATERVFGAGMEARMVTSMNTVANHLESLRKYAAALKNGDLRLANEIGNRIATETGHAAPTNFGMAREIAGDEISRAVVGGVGAMGDRDAIKAGLLTKNSPEELEGAIDTAQEFIGGRLSELRRQYARDDPARIEKFNKEMLSPLALQRMGGATAGATSTPAGTDLPKITDQAAYDALPDGAEYLGPDGSRHKKGQR